MSSDKYILDENGNPKPEPDLFKWAKWLETTDRRLARTRLAGYLFVSTVFLGLDHNFDPTGPPILWETMSFHHGNVVNQWRYATREQALAGHNAAVQELRKHLRN